MTKEYIMPGPALFAATDVRTNIPVPIIAPMPSIVSENAPSERCNDFFSAVARMSSSGLMRQPMNDLLVFGVVDFACIGARGFIADRDSKGFVRVGIE